MPLGWKRVYNGSVPRKGAQQRSDKIYTIDEIRRIASPIAAQYGVARLYLFGSYARGEATSRSDKGSLCSMFQLAGLQMELEKSIAKPLDVLTTQMISPQFLARIKSEKVLIYAQS